MPIKISAKPTFFKTPADWREWLEKNHSKKTELLVGFHKRHTGTRCITWKESVDEALCFGWIDGVRKKIDANTYTIRFTPRKKTSIWSAKNIKRIGELAKLGLVAPAGQKAFDERDTKKQNLYSFEQNNIAFTPAQLKRFKANKKAWKYFESMPLSYRKPATWWAVSAKQEATREKRFGTLIADSEAGRKIKPLSY
ncbi:MAG TPA: YdeI/OmpD-associated family protein [Candidatus Kapabacteria bacterium]|nr:YdeI/OmpD-associated family protein [Candidatus Kapabacteria bacterium]